MLSKIFYTLLVYLRPGQETVFQEYENKVLPLLPEYQGKLEFRLKTTNPHPDHPDEVHVVSFPTAQDFEAYRQNPERVKYETLLKTSVNKVILIPGTGLL